MPATTEKSAAKSVARSATRFPTAVICDACGTLFDVHSVVAATEQVFPGHGDALSQLWRLKQIEYTQLNTLSDPAGARYRPFRISRQRLPVEELGVASHDTGSGVAELADFLDTAALPERTPARPRAGA